MQLQEGYASLFWEYEEGRRVREYYLGANGIRVQLPDGTAWLSFVYDGAGQLLKTVRMDAGGNPLD